MRKHREEKINAPVVLVKWYDFTRWLLERVDNFPKNQRFIFGTRLADWSLRVLEILVDASYRPQKAEQLADANRQIEVLRWLVRLAKDRKLLSTKQYGFACEGLIECGPLFLFRSLSDRHRTRTRPTRRTQLSEFPIRFGFIVRRSFENVQYLAAVCTTAARNGRYLNSAVTSPVEDTAAYSR